MVGPPGELPDCRSEGERDWRLVSSLVAVLSSGPSSEAAAISTFSRRNLYSEDRDEIGVRRGDVTNIARGAHQGRFDGSSNSTDANSSTEANNLPLRSHRCIAAGGSQNDKRRSNPFFAFVTLFVGKPRFESCS